MVIGVLCETRPGLRASERAVTVVNVHGRKEHLRIEADYLRVENGRTYLPVALIYEHGASGSALVELPLEADSGTRRLFVPLADTVKLAQVSA